MDIPTWMAKLWSLPHNKEGKLSPMYALRDYNTNMDRRRNARRSGGILPPWGPSCPPQGGQEPGCHDKLKCISQGELSNYKVFLSQFSCYYIMREKLLIMIVVIFSPTSLDQRCVGPATALGHGAAAIQGS